MQQSSPRAFGLRPAARFLFRAALVALSVLLQAPSRSAAQSTLTVTELIATLKDKNKPRRLAAAKALGDLGTAAKEATSALADLLRDNDAEIRRQALQALAQIGIPALPRLVRALKDDQTTVRVLAIEGIALMGPDAISALPVLLEAVNDAELLVRVSALKALLDMGPLPDKGKTVLEKAAKDPVPYVSLLATAILEKSQPREGKQPEIMPGNLLLGIGNKPITPEQDALFDRMVDAWIITDTHDRRPSPAVFEQNKYGVCIFSAGPEAIPAIVRGINKAYNLGTACPMTSLASQLRINLLPYCTNPSTLDYVIENLGKGVRFTWKTDARKAFNEIKQMCLNRKAELIYLQLAAEREVAIQQLVVKMADLSDADLKAALSHRLADARLAALYVVAQKRLHCEDALIERLVDPDSRVTQLARQCLIRLARGTDFGPPPVADAADLVRSQARWKKWWQQQDRNPAPVKLVVVSEGQDDPKKLGAALDDAAAGDRAKLLAKLRDGDGIDYTTALAAAIGRLTDEPQQQARAALVERLGKLTAGAAREKLRDGDAEVRRAAAAACAAQADREFVPDLVGLLLDADPEVTAAGRAALRTLTGEDFGSGREAALKWRDWWAKKEKR